MVERNIKYLENISLDEIKGFGEKRLSSFKKHGIKKAKEIEKDPKIKKLTKDYEKAVNDYMKKYG